MEALDERIGSTRMTANFVLMTALPPTKGHGDLIRFAAEFPGETIVIVSTQENEPFWGERVWALEDFTRSMPRVVVINEHSEGRQQEPLSDKDFVFWGMWVNILRENGFRPGDRIIASETYGAELAKHAGGKFIPYDIARDIRYTKGTIVRQYPEFKFASILPEFQKYLRTRVTVFGAESTGKTTLSRHLAAAIDSVWLPEWARPYLETVGPELTLDSMFDIVLGQRAIQNNADALALDFPYIVQDTDLYSTLGYYLINNMPIPEVLPAMADKYKSDLYIITPSNIPFEPDPIRYGGDVRESSDQFWISLAKEHSLPYIVLESNNPTTRLSQALEVVQQVIDRKSQMLKAYQREGAEYGTPA